MSISAVMNTALSGMMANSRQAATSARNVANAQTAGYDKLQTSFSTKAAGGVDVTVASSGSPDPSGYSNVDLAEEAMNLLEAEIGYKANAAVLEAGADLWDVLATVKRD